MSVDYSAVTIVGVEYDELFGTVDVAETVTRYSELDGKPYEKTVTHQRRVLVDRTLSKEDSEYVEKYGWPEYFSDKLRMRWPLEEYQSQSYSDGAETIVGISLAEADPGECAPVDKSAIDQAFKSVKATLKKIGYTEEPELFTICGVH